MSFPARFNINYYMGDTYEFRIFPKDASGAPFPLAQFATQSGNVRFTIATKRGQLGENDPLRVNGYAEISADRTSILCSITPENAAGLIPGRPYVYDVEISRTSSPYNQVFTLLTGNISIEDQVTPIIPPPPPPPPPPPLQAPGPIQSQQVSNVGTSSLTVTWVAPNTGGAPANYKLYIVPYNPLLENTTSLTQLVAALPTVSPFTTTSTTFNFTSTTAVPLFGLPSFPLTPNTPYIYAIVAANSAGDSPPLGNFNVAAGTIDEVFTAQVEVPYEES